MMDWVFSLLVLGVLAMLGGAWVLFRRGVRRQAWLMVLLAIVMAVNLAIWTIPDQNGRALLDEAGNRAARS